MLTFPINCMLVPHMQALVKMAVLITLFLWLFFFFFSFHNKTMNQLTTALTNVAVSVTESVQVFCFPSSIPFLLTRVLGAFPLGLV